MPQVKAEDVVSWLVMLAQRLNQDVTKAYPAARNVRSWSTSMSSAKLLDLMSRDKISTCSSDCDLANSFLSLTSCPQMFFNVLVAILNNSLSFQGSIRMNRLGKIKLAVKYTAFSVVGSSNSS